MHSNNRAPERQGGCDPASCKLGEVLSLSADFERDAEETRATSFISSTCSIDTFPRVPPRARYTGAESARGWAPRQHSEEGRGSSCTSESLNAADRWR